MKLRMRHNSLRLRLSRREVDQLGHGGHVLESVAFGPDPEQRLTFLVQSTASSDAITASFAYGLITVSVPAGMAADWAAGDAITLEAMQAVDNDWLQLTIEKDFACLKPRGDEDADAFEHPTPHLNC